MESFLQDRGDFEAKEDINGTFPFRSQPVDVMANHIVKKENRESSLMCVNLFCDDNQNTMCVQNDVFPEVKHEKISTEEPNKYSYFGLHQGKYFAL
eukprot:1911640-Ditylum_brightwellii.AAC.1